MSRVTIYWKAVMDEKKPSASGSNMPVVRIRLRLGGGDTRVDSWSGRSAPSPFALGTSLSLHTLMVALLLHLPFSAPRDEGGTYVVRKVVPLMPEKKVIWYLAERELPKVSPPIQSSTKGPPPRPTIRAPQRIVTAPEARKGKQFVWIPAPDLHLTKDLRAPNIIVLRTPPPAPPPERARPRIFQPPSEKHSAVQSPTLPAPPEVKAGSTSETAPGSQFLANRSQVSRPPARVFVPPPSRGTGSKGVGTVGVPAPPELGGGGGEGGGVGSDVSLAIIGVNPKQTASIPIPAGDRIASISVGPDSGKSHGRGSGGDGGGISIPGVSISGGSGTSGVGRSVRDAKPTTFPSRAAIQILRQVPSSPAMPPMPMVSAPHWPGARTLPPEIEKRFSGRTVYATVFPSPAQPASVDWTLWFAERAPRRSGTRPLMRPPAPVLAAGMPIPVIPRSMLTVGRLELAGTLGREGRLNALAPISAVDPVLAGTAIAALLNWQFTPAVCSGAPLDVDVVIVIPTAEQ